MPSGEVHSITTGLAAAGSWFVTQPLLGPQASLAVCVGCLAGALLTPDLDVNNGSISNHHARRTFGSVVGVVWEVIWKPYSWIIPHRSPLSHMPVLGTAIRLFYLSCVVYLVLSLVGIAVPTVVPAALPWWLPFVFIGLVLSDTLHWFLDMFVKGF